MDIFERSKHRLSLSVYEQASGELMQQKHTGVFPPGNQYILRMMVKGPESDGLRVPEQLRWLRPTIELLTQIQKDRFVYDNSTYVYVTVRTGIVKSVTDQEWHVDGFSMRSKHLPEQNYIWSDCYPTEVLDQQFTIPKDFDPMVHNLHTYFQDHADPYRVVTLKEKHLCLIDPYVVHRRPVVPVGVRRCFFRVSFVPIEIEDDTCTPNPLLEPKVYNREDIRKKLIRYTADNDIFRKLRRPTWHELLQMWEDWANNLKDEKHWSDILKENGWTLAEWARYVEEYNPTL